MLLKLVLPLLILAGTLPIARADDASKRAKIQELFQVMDTRANMDRTEKLAMAQVYTNVTKLLPSSKNMTVEQQAQLKQFYEQIEAIVANEVSWDKVEPLFEKVYADAFTERQLDDLIAFYNSPTGKALIKKLPMLQKESFDIANQQTMKAIPKVREAMEEFEKQCQPQQKTPPPETAGQN